MSHEENYGGAERRSNPELREIFEEAYALVEPFLDPARSWGGTAMEMLALRDLRNHYPFLTVAQAHILVVAFVRVHRERGTRS